jgi:hypothetical protein
MSESGLLNFRIFRMSVIQMVKLRNINEARQNYDSGVYE